MNIASLTASDSAAIAQKLEKQAQTASNAATQLAKQVQKQQPPSADVTQHSEAGRHGSPVGHGSGGSTAGAASGIAQAAASAAGLNQIA